MELRTRVDKLVWLRERAEDDKLSSLARARADVDRTREEVERALEGTRRDARTCGPVEFWVMEDDGHRRAVQTLHHAQAQVQRAAAAEVVALDEYSAARKDALAVRRVQERRRVDQRAEIQRRERRALDELATLRFNSPA